MRIVRQFLTCALLTSAVLAALESALFFRDARRSVAALVDQAALTRTALVAELSATRSDLNGQIAATRTDLLARSERQADLLRRDLFGETDRIRNTADRRLGDTLARADTALATVAGLRQDLQPMLRGAATTEESASAMLDAYRALPAQLGRKLSPSWDKIEPEITCAQTNGTGYGGCWHARITAVLGEAANAGGVFTRQFPAFAGSTAGIAHDVHTFTSRAVAPRGFWGTFKDLVGTGSGLTRALGAAGLFEQQAAVPKQ